MTMQLTRDEQLVLGHLISGESSEEIAATLNWPLQAVRNCTDTLITWVLDELGAIGRTPSAYLPAPPLQFGSEGQRRLWVAARSGRGPGVGAAKGSGASPAHGEPAPQGEPAMYLRDYDPGPGAWPLRPSSPVPTSLRLTPHSMVASRSLAASSMSARMARRSLRTASRRNSSSERSPSASI